MGICPQTKARNNVLATRNRLIKELVATGEFTQEEVARMFRVKQPIVSIVVRNKNSHKAAK